MELGYPVPGLALNTLACIAAKRGAAARAKELLTEAQRVDPQHWVLAKNLQAAANGDLSSLVAKHEFQLLERIAQPTLPGPLKDDFAVWGPPPPPPQRPVGSTAAARKLRVVSA
jgi:hypothetical protein